MIEQIHGEPDGLPVLDDSASAWITHVVQDCSRIAPTLVPILMTLVPFSDVLTSCMFGPQPQAKDYDPEEPQHMVLGVRDPHYPGNDCEGESIDIRITAHQCLIQWCHLFPDSPECDSYDEDEVTLEQLWEYLRQIPRGYEAFVRRSRL